MDKELAILEELHINNNISQREVSERTGISLGNVNILLKKMIKEGLIKIEQIPANRVAYMLTPKGMLEKANKTYNYITKHYSYIESQRKGMDKALERILDENNEVQILLSNDGPSEIFKLVLNNHSKSKGNKINVVDEKEIIKLDSSIKVLVLKDREDLQNFETINIFELM